MGQLHIITVTGTIPHSACFFDYTDVKYADGWLGFGPATHGRPAGDGKVFTDDESHRLNHGVIFEVGDSVLMQAASLTKAQYSTGPYVVTVRDCVSFSADVARRCGLGVPALNFTPYGLIKVLAFWNKTVKSW